MKRLVLATFVIALVCLVTTASMPAKAGVANRIAFVRVDVDNSEEVWAMNPDGTGQQLMAKVDRPYYPNITPDGSILVGGNQRCGKIARAGGCKGVLKFPGGKLVFPLDQLPYQMEGVEGPNGTTVALVALNDRATAQIYLIQGGVATNFATGSSPTWSPDGGKIAYWRENIIYVKDMAGNEFALGVGCNPSWSPDGSRIAANIVGSGTPQSTDLVIYQSSGGNPQTIVSGMGVYGQSWLNVDTIVFEGAKVEIKTGWNWDLWVVNTATGQVSQLTNTPQGETWPNAGN